MRCNWLRLAVLTGIAAAAGVGLQSRAFAAGTHNEFIYVHDTAGIVHITHMDERNGALLPLGAVPIAPTSPASTLDAQTLAYSPRLRLLVIANGNGGAGTGTLSVARVNLNGSLTLLGGPQAVPGSGDLTAVAVVETSAQVFVYAADPAPKNQIFSFRLGSTGALTLLGPPLPTGTDPRGITESNKFVFVINSLSQDFSVFHIVGTGALAVAGPNVPVEGAISPRNIKAVNNFIYVTDCNPPPSVGNNRRFFVFKVRSATNIRQVFDSPYQTADQSICSFSICGNLLVVVGLRADTNFQTGVLRKGLPTGAGELRRVQNPYEIGKFEPECKYVVAARSGPEGDVRSLRIGGGRGRIQLVQGGVAPMSTGTAFVNGLAVVDL
jgi:Lactonase, 7-bladed beta-propeller